MRYLLLFTIFNIFSYMSCLAMNQPLAIAKHIPTNFADLSEDMIESILIFAENPLAFRSVNKFYYNAVRKKQYAHILQQHENKNPSLRKSYLPPLAFKDTGRIVIFSPNTDSFYGLNHSQLFFTKKERENPTLEQQLYINRSKFETKKWEKLPYNCLAPSPLLIACLTNDESFITQAIKECAKENKERWSCNPKVLEIEMLSPIIPPHLSELMYKMIAEANVGAKNNLMEIASEIGIIDKLNNSRLNPSFDTRLQEEEKSEEIITNRSYPSGWILFPIAAISLLLIFRKPIMDIMLKNC